MHLRQELKARAAAAPSCSLHPPRTLVRPACSSKPGPPKIEQAIEVDGGLTILVDQPEVLGGPGGELGGGDKGARPSRPCTVQHLRPKLHAHPPPSVPGLLALIHGCQILPTCFCHTGIRSYYLRGSPASGSKALAASGLGLPSSGAVGQVRPVFRIFTHETLRP